MASPLCAYCLGTFRSKADQIAVPMDDGRDSDDESSECARPLLPPQALAHAHAQCAAKGKEFPKAPLMLHRKKCYKIVWDEIDSIRGAREQRRATRHQQATAFAIREKQERAAYRSADAELVEDALRAYPVVLGWRATAR